METAIKSEVELNARNIFEGDELFYTDNDNCQKWIVKDVFKWGFEATDGKETGEFNFSDLQIGWTISEKTKRVNKTFRRTQYK